MIKQLANIKPHPSRKQPTRSAWPYFMCSAKNQRQDSLLGVLHPEDSRCQASSQPLIDVRGFAQGLWGGIGKIVREWAHGSATATSTRTDPGSMRPCHHHALSALLTGQCVEAILSAPSNGQHVECLPSTLITGRFVNGLGSAPNAAPSVKGMPCALHTVRYVKGFPSTLNTVSRVKCLPFTPTTGRQAKGMLCTNLTKHQALSDSSTFCTGTGSPASVGFLKPNPVYHRQSPLQSYFTSNKLPGHIDRWLLAPHLPPTTLPCFSDGTAPAQLAARMPPPHLPAPG